MTKLFQHVVSPLWMQVQRILLWAALALIALSAAAQPSPAARVMPLGDSITAGSYGAGKNGIGGYRAELWAKCQRAGLEVDFVGTWNDPTNTTFNAHHQGWRGGRIDDLKSRLSGWMTQCRPKIILLQIGVNDLIKGATAEIAASRFDSLLSTLHSASPGAKVYAASILNVLEPNDYKVQPTMVKQYNALIANTIAEHTRKGMKVSFVDLDREAALREADFSPDRLHPNDSGYAKMAEVWFKVLQSALTSKSACSLSISSNGHFFVDGTGQPFFWQGDTEWELFHSFTEADAKTLMEMRRSQGFNVLQVMATGLYREQSLREGAMKEAKPAEEIPAWLNNDPLQPNERYFQRMDVIVKDAERCNLMLVVGVYHSQDQRNGRINATNAESWCRFLGQRYKEARNIIWSMYPQASSWSEPAIRGVVKGLREGDGGSHLITMHPDPSPASSSFMHNEPWLSFNTLQTFAVDMSNYNMVRRDYLRTPPKVVVNGEARYEDEEGTTPFEVRRAGYWACLAGGFYSYGHGKNWTSPRNWQAWLDAPGARQVKLLGELFRGVSWWKLVADKEILVNAAKGNVAARSSDGDWVLAYLVDHSPLTIQMGKLTASRQVEASWINPRTGETTQIGTYPASGVRSFSMPADWEDAVLLCRKAEK